jgi:hypothetical protein
MLEASTDGVAATNRRPSSVIFQPQNPRRMNPLRAGLVDEAL